ncbi:MAG: hypothetical protein H6R17_2666 [Proteobacteria bacterium]|nr:hypothetical protein [Pseudomonadota bacterium]
MATEAHYQQVLALSQRMLAAGMAQHWDELVALEAQRQTLLDQAPATTPNESRPLSELIGEIQQCDAQLSEKLEAWLSHARILLRMDAKSSPKS